MEFNTQKIEGVTVVELKTDVLDANNAKEFRADISPILEKNQKVVFDMSQVGFLDSSGCGTILSCLRLLNSAGGDLKMFGLQKRPYAVRAYPHAPDHRNFQHQKRGAKVLLKT